VTPRQNPLSVREGSSAGRITIRLDDGILWISIEDEVPGDSIVAAFRKALAAGWIQLNMATLVDLTRFTGSVDWAAIHTIKDLAPWGTAPAGKSQVAYLVRDDLFGVLIRVTGALFARSHHRAFIDEAAALAWLRAP
jgi:hypothetical protein